MGILTIGVGSLNPVKIEAVKEIYPFANVEGYDADCDITNWLGPEGQPMGLTQTCDGAFNRARNTFIYGNGRYNFAIGMENGLILNDEGQWLDKCVICIYSELCHICQVGDGVVTEFEWDNSEREKSFTDYHNIIMPIIKSGQDLYEHWTKGKFTRKDFLKECLRKAKTQYTGRESIGIILECSGSLFSASIGTRYQWMFFIRDFDIMMESYIKISIHSDIVKIFELIISNQRPDGSIPTCIITNKEKWLHNRLVKTGWREKWNTLFHTAGMIPPTDLKEFYQMTKYHSHLSGPQASYSVRRFMAGEIDDITPGTFDSEIHFISAYMTFGNFTIDISSVDKAFEYLYSHIVNDDTQLPKGADTRDMFGRLLSDSYLLSNGCYLYNVYQKMVAVQRPEINRLIEKYNIISRMETLQISLRVMVANDIDFYPGPATFTRDALLPQFIQKLIEDNPNFLTGTMFDPHGTALAVLNGIIEPKDYNIVLDKFLLNDSPAGICSFVPISGTETDEEQIVAANGMIVWPHIEYLFDRMCLFMNTSRSKEILDSRKSKIFGFNEWYHMLPDGKLYCGGESGQGWSASRYRDLIKLW